MTKVCLTAVALMILSYAKDVPSGLLAGTVLSSDASIGVLVELIAGVLIDLSARIINTVVSDIGVSSDVNAAVSLNMMVLLKFITVP